MRKTRKPEEDKYIKIFTDFLTSQGKVIEINNNITDRPDLLFEMDKATIACELTNIGIPELQRWHRLPIINNDELDEIDIPFEPEYWGLEILKRKYDPKYEVEYDDLWLLVHIDNGMMILNEKDFGIDNIKRIAYFFYVYCDSGYYSHKFNRVYLAIDNDVILLWQRGDIISMSKLLNQPPPMQVISQFQSTLTNKGINIDISSLPKKQLTLPPLNKLFKLRK